MAPDPRDVLRGGAGPQSGGSRIFSTLEYHEASYRVAAPDTPVLFRIIRRLRNRLEAYISLHPQFADSLTPLTDLPASAPESALRMHRASMIVGVGPMAAVAGTFAQIAAEKLSSMRENGTGANREVPEIIIENGGDIFAVLRSPLIVGLWVGPSSPFRDLAFRIEPRESPIAICSSSSSMGHSYSEGSCDLVTVFSRDASLADACATAVCNRIKNPEQLQEAVEWGCLPENINGVLAIMGDKLSVAGNIPQLVRSTENKTGTKVSRHRNSSFSHQRAAGKGTVPDSQDQPNSCGRKSSEEREKY